MKSIGWRIKLLREAKGWTQAELARLLHEHGADVNDRSTIASWEANIRLPATETVLILAKVLGCTTDYLFLLSDDPNGHGPADAPIPPGWAELAEEAQARGIRPEELRAALDLIEKVKRLR